MMRAPAAALSAEAIGERLAVAVEQASDTVVITDPEGTILYVNPAFERATGYSRREALGKNPSILKSGLHSRAFYDELWDTIRSGKVWSGVFINRRKDGALFEEESRISPIFAPDGAISGFVAVKRDLSERRQREKEVREAERRYRALFENSRDAIFITDAEGRLVDFNRAAIELTGYSPAELGKLKISDLVPRKAERDAFMAAVEEQGSANQIEQRIRRADGTELECLVSASAWISTEGEVLGYQSIVRDVSRKRRSERLVQRLLEAFPDPVLMTDRKGRILLANRVAGKVFACSPLHLIDRSLSEFVRVSSEGRPGGCCDILEALEKGCQGLQEWCVIAGDGSELPVEVTLGRAETDDGSYVVVSLRDVREKKALQTHLCHALKLESIGRLAAGVAHEINTPIQYVGDNARFLEEAFRDLLQLCRSYDELLAAAEREGTAAEAVAAVRDCREETDLDYLLEEIPRAIEQTLDGVGRVASIVRAMKQFSHPAKRREPSDLNAAIESTVTVARNEWKYVAELDLELDPELPAVPCVLSDINQVVLNLVVNAAHAIAEVRGERPEDKGSITVRTRVEDRFAVLEVEDDGCGIPPENLERIFEPFFTTKEVGKGTGQGLAMAHHIVVDGHGGTIAVDSEVGRGTKFTIRLPLDVEDETEHEETQP